MYATTWFWRPMVEQASDLCKQGLRLSSEVGSQIRSHIDLGDFGTLQPSMDA
jgi:hypothetical protein